MIIKSNDPQRPEVHVNVKGFVKRAIIKDPLGGLVIKTLERKPGQVGTVRLKNQMDEPMRLQYLRSTIPDVEVELREITPGLEVEVIGRTKGELKKDRYKGEVFFSTGLKREPEFSVYVSIRVMPRVDPSPPAMLLLKEPKPVTRVGSLHCYAPDALEKFRITAIECADPNVKVSFEPTRPPERWMTERMKPPITATAKFTVDIAAPDKLVNDIAKVLISTTDPEFPKIELLVTTNKDAFRAVVYGPDEE